uniref:Glucuronosyltransferase n=1 Tax=Elaeophora elaphi TaxID=1147741 RepID=A0A0R3S166_9BILA
MTTGLRLTARNVGMMLEKQNLSKESIEEALEYQIFVVIYRYKKKMLIFQDMMTDMLYSELNHSIFWVEFIERHNEIPHARSGADDLNAFQYFLLGIILCV